MKKANKKKAIKNLATWILLVCFLLTYFLDITGLEFHQYLGIFSAAVLILHIATHMDWIVSMTQRLFTRLSSTLRVYYSIDFLILVGFLTITLSGVLISTWLELDAAIFLPLLSAHIIASMVTLLFLISKLLLHWKYFARSLRFQWLKRYPNTSINTPANPVRSEKLYSRREALRTMGIVSLAGFFGLYKATQALPIFKSEQLPDPYLTITKSEPSGLALEPSSIESIPQEQLPVTDVSESRQQRRRRGNSDLSAEPPITNKNLEIQPSINQEFTPTPEVLTGEACIVRCPGGCSYPGRCRRYVDENANQLCDLGECMVV